jgi:archaellum component FlaC
MESEILKELKKINTRLDMIENKINSIIENNNNIEKDVAKMNNHITFVETTYSSIRKPLSFIKNKIDCMMGNYDQHDLPLLTNSNCSSSDNISYKQLQ